MKLTSVNERNIDKLRRYQDLKFAIEKLEKHKKEDIEVSMDFSLCSYGKLWSEYIPIDEGIKFLLAKMRKLEAEIKML